MKGFTATVAVVILAFAVAHYQPNSAHNLLQKLKNTLFSYSTSKSRPGNAAGIFAQGCRWRDAPLERTTATTSESFWDVQHYEYWNESTQTWSSEQPNACRLRPVPFNSSLVENKSNKPSTRRRCAGDDYCVFENLWYSQGKFYYLTDDKNGMVCL